MHCAFWLVSEKVCFGQLLQYVNAFTVHILAKYSIWFYFLRLKDELVLVSPIF